MPDPLPPNLKQKKQQFCLNDRTGLFIISLFAFVLLGASVWFEKEGTDTLATVFGTVFTAYATLVKGESKDEN